MDERPARDEDPEVHPRGTLAIVAIYGLLFLVGWLFFFFGVFQGRGHVH
jgi:hypothetical protein